MTFIFYLVISTTIFQEYTLPKLLLLKVTFRVNLLQKNILENKNSKQKDQEKSLKLCKIQESSAIINVQFLALLTIWLLLCVKKRSIWERTTAR